MHLSGGCKPHFPQRGSTCSLSHISQKVSEKSHVSAWKQMLRCKNTMEESKGDENSSPFSTPSKQLSCLSFWKFPSSNPRWFSPVQKGWELVPGRWSWGPCWLADPFGEQNFWAKGVAFAALFPQFGGLLCPSILESTYLTSATLHRHIKHTVQYISIKPLKIFLGWKQINLGKESVSAKGVFKQLCGDHLFSSQDQAPFIFAVRAHQIIAGHSGGPDSQYW